MTVTLYNGVVADTPTLLTDKIRVSVPDLITMSRKTYGPMTYNPYVSGGGEARLPQRGDKAVIGVDDGVGDQWVVAWHRDDPSSSDLVTSLPTTDLYDGQEVKYLADSAKDIIWVLRYRASSGKWSMMAGTPLVSGPQGTATVTTAGAADLALTGGPSLVVPLNGEYWVSMACFMQTNTAGLTDLRAILYDDASQVGAPTARRLYAVGQAAFDGGIYYNRFNVTSLVAGHTLTMKVASSGVACSFSNAQIELLPRRIG